MISLSDFLSQPNVTEAVRVGDYGKAINTISKLLNKYSIFLSPVSSSIEMEGKHYMSFTAMAFKGSGDVPGALINWSADSRSAEIASIAFTSNMMAAMDARNFGEEYKYELVVPMVGVSIAKCTDLIKRVLIGDISMDEKSIKEWLGDALISEAMVQEATDPALQKEINNTKMKLNSARKRGNQELVAKHEARLHELLDKKLELGTNVTVRAVVDSTITKAEEELEERVDPETRFEDMRRYIGGVLKGIRPLALLCGAPGVGKTFRVMRDIKSMGKEMGRDYVLCKGKVTAPQLYKSFFMAQEKGQFVVFDDCDSIFDDANTINILKAAFDSGEERWISWRTSTGVEMDDSDPDEFEIIQKYGLEQNRNGKYKLPSIFEFKGGGIIITNLRAGMIDTAVRNRALICDLDFTVTEILDLVRGVMPFIRPDDLDDRSKAKALKYLERMVDEGKSVEISIRSFATCAEIYTFGAPDKDAERMISEQMRLQVARGGKRY